MAIPNFAVHRGFTLIEMMVVVAIVGMLSSVALPSFRDYVIRARFAEVLAIAGEKKTNYSEFYTIHGRVPTLQEAGTAACLLCKKQVFEAPLIRA